MKKMFYTALAVMLFACAFAVTAQARDVYLEPIPNELKVEDDVATHFVVFEEEKYFSGSGNTLYGLNSAQIESDMARSGIDSSKIGKEYLTRFNFPAKLGANQISYVNLNAIKTNVYFKNVCGYVQLMGSVSQIHDMNQSTKELRCIDFGKDSKITSIPLMFAANAKHLMSVKNFPRNLTIVSKQAFNNCYGAFRGELYVNATFIEENAFNNAISNVTSLVLGPNVKSIGNGAFCVFTGEFSSFYAPLGRGVAIKSIEFQCDVSAVAFHQQGVDTGSFYFSANTARTPYSKLKCIVLSHPDNAALVKEGSVFNDFTTKGVNVLFKDADGTQDFVSTSHSLGADKISYESFMEMGKTVKKCTVCGAEAIGSAQPLFTCLGYSAAESGTGSITLGFLVNLELVEQYEASTGRELQYGLFAVAQEKIGNNALFDKNGKAKEGVIYKDLRDNIFSCIAVKVTGIETENQRNAKIALGVYAVNGSKIDYLQMSAPQGTEAYSFISYKEIAVK